MKWIDVKDQLPTENHDWYLVSDGNIVTIGSWDFSGFVGCVHELKKIKYWMPLPEAPKDV